MKIYMGGRDAPNEAHCRSCGASITWVKNITTSKTMPIDGGLDCVKVIGDGQGEVDLKATPSHFSTCKDAERWRRR